MTESQRIGLWVFYDEKGEIKVRGYMSESEAEHNAEQYGLSVLFGVADETIQYVVADELVERPALAVTLVGSKLKGVPLGASVTIEGIDYTADGSDIELEFSHIGTFTITISKFPYISVELTYENLA